MDEFEHTSPIDFDLLNEKDFILINRLYLAGETPLMKSVEKFYPVVQDSIFYICYPHPKVYVIKHLDPLKSKLLRDTLFKMIKAHDNKLIDAEK